MKRAPVIPLFFLAILFAASASLPWAHAVKVGRNVNLTSNVPKWAWEPAIAVDPMNLNVIAGAAFSNIFSPFPPLSFPEGWHVYFRSTDGGVTWSSRLLPGFPGDTSPEGLTSPLRSFDSGGSDVDAAFDRLGNLYISGEMANFTGPSGFTSGGFSLTAFVAKFANDGADFVRATLISSGIDFPKIAVDNTGGPNDGNIYLSFFTPPTSSSQGSSFTRSTDGGLTFSKLIPLPGGGRPQMVTVDAVGNVYVLSSHCTQKTSGCVDDGSSTLLVNKSTDGGLTFGKAVVAATINPIPEFLTVNGVDTATSPQITADANGIYIVTDDFRTGDANVLLMRSTDSGVTWSSPITVNDVTQGQQFFPAITSSGGIISVAWYDSRLGQLSNGTITGLDVFYAESRNAGASFSKSVRVTSVSFNPNLVINPFFLEPFIGDYIGIAASPTAVHPIWTDNRNACDNIDPTFGCIDQDIYTATITP